MSRQIKFRVWDKNKEKMKQLEELYCFNFSDNFTSGIGELMQYTGLKDKNGKDIYEGDIVKAYRYGEIEREPCINKIGFMNGCFTFGNWAWIEFMNKFRYAEVIGNIYESPTPPEKE